MAAKKSPQKKSAETRAYNREVARGTSRREEFEQAYPARNRDLASSLADSWRQDTGLHEKLRRNGLDPESWINRQETVTRDMSPRLTYRLMGWTGHDSETNHPRQGVLFQDPNLMENPRHWEDHSQKERDRITRAAAKHGVTYESAYKAYSSQLDRAMVRENGRHRSFYSEEGVTDTGSLSPRSRLLESAKNNDVPFSVQTSANAITSPQNRFVQTVGGKTRYPNDEAANDAIRRAKAGETGDQYLYHPDYYVPPEDKVKNPRTGKLKRRPDDLRRYPQQGYPANAALAIDVTRQVLSGVPLGEAWKPTDADKVKPFHNAWTAPHSPEGNYHVSDTHSGAAGFAPHIADNGKAEKQYMGIKGIHSFHDYVARQVLADRGLVSVSRAQSAQWNQEKLEHGGTSSDVSDLTHKAHPVLGNQFKDHVHPDQGELF